MTLPILKSNFDNIPAELKEFHHWVCWKEELREGEDKPTKPPYQINGRLAKTNDPKTWTSFSKAVNALNNSGGFNGIGVCLGNGTPNGIDLDGCRCPAFDNMILPWAKEIIDEIDSYTEASPSGKGIRIFVNSGPLPPQGRKKGPIEIYESGRYLTVTGNHIPDTPKTINDRPEAVLAFHRRIFGTDSEGPEPGRKPSPGRLGNWRERLDRAFQSRSGPDIQRLWDGDYSAYQSQSEADLALCSHLAFWLDGDAGNMDAAFRASGLMREKWSVKHHSDGRTYGEATIEQAIKGCRTFYQEPTINIPSPIGDKIPPVDSPNLAFPDIIRGAAGYFAEIFSDCLEPPPHFFFLSYLTCLGSVLADQITLKSELNPQPRLYCIILGESADDKKSTTITKTVEFFQSAVPDFPICLGVGSAEGLQRRLAKDSRLLLVYDEFKAFVSKSKVDGSVLLPCVTSLFEANRYESHTKDREVSLTGVCLSLLAASTVDTYERTWDATFTDIGLNNRLFLVPGAGKRRFAIPGRVPQHERDILKNELRNVLQAATTSELDITPEARALYSSWYLNLEQSIHTKRLDTYALRFMILLTVNAGKTAVDEEIVQDVIDLMNWQLQTRRLHDPIDADSAVAKIEEKIRRVLTTGPRSDRDLKRTVHYNRIGTWVFTNAVRNLTGSREIRFDKTANFWSLT